MMSDLKLKAATLFTIFAVIAASLTVSGTGATNYTLGDANHDGLVNLKDIMLLAIAWMSVTGDMNFNPDCDFDSNGIINIEDATYIGLNWTVFLNSHVYIMPESLNAKSQGRWITAVILLSEEANATGVDVSSIKLNETISASKVSIYNFSDVLMVKFSRQAVITLIRESLSAQPSVNCKESYQVTLTVIGKLANGLWFSGSDTVRVLHLNVD